VPVSQIRSLFPSLKNPSNRHKAVGFTPEQWHYAFTNTQSREESDEVYERYHIPASGRLVWVGPLSNFTPGHQENYVNFSNEDRAPLLFISGSEDNIMPPAGFAPKFDPAPELQILHQNYKQLQHTKNGPKCVGFIARSADAERFVCC
jgi:hypothetical protein